MLSHPSWSAVEDLNHIVHDDNDTLLCAARARLNRALQLGEESRIRAAVDLVRVGRIRDIYNPIKIPVRRANQPASRGGRHGCVQYPAPRLNRRPFLTGGWNPRDH